MKEVDGKNSLRPGCSCSEADCRLRGLSSTPWTAFGTDRY